ncbi:MAG: ABC transporter permease [Ignavibacteriae bacterium]|nr:ABC transporter permease [Ignavibacteriota bacterium]
MQPVELFLASRYLFAKRSVRFVNIITIISIGGITIGVAALLIVLSVFNGFSGIVTKVLVGFDPHVRIEKSGGFDSTQYSNIERAVHSLPQVIASAPVLSGKAMIITKNRNVVVIVRGVDEQKVSTVSGLNSSIIAGELKFNPSSEVGGMVIGLTLAEQLGCMVGEEVTVVSPGDFEAMFQTIATPEFKSFRITGIFLSNNKEYDANYAYVSLPWAQSLFNVGGQIHALEARLTNFEDAEFVKNELSKKLPSDIQISTWQDLHLDLYFVMMLERWAGYIILSLIIVVASFNLMGSLAMSIVEKKRDIGILQTLGMTSRRIKKAFIYEGLLVGIIGTTLGILLGIFVLYLQVNYQLFALDTSVYIIPAIPVEIHAIDFLSVAVVSLGLSLLSAYYPSNKITEYQPSECIRWE